MTPWLDDGDVRLYHGDALEQLALMPSESVQCVVTSPPFWGLRDYSCEGQIGLEETPDEWCARLVRVMREARRVLRNDGVCWIELGDTYASTPSGMPPGPERWKASGLAGKNSPRYLETLAGSAETVRAKKPPGVKQKDLVGAPWLLAFALRADGWYLRSEIIWWKVNPMPESVTDRVTRGHSTIFMLSKSARYFADMDAIREGEGSGRNARSVWAIPSEPFSARALGCDTYYKASPDCSVHGLDADPQSWEQAARDEQPAEARLHRIDGTRARHALAQRAELASTPLRTSETRSSATPHSTQSHRTALALETTQPCTPSGETTLRTAGTSDPPASAETHASTPASSTDSDDSPEAVPLADTSSRTARKCSCSRHSIDHFATFPQALVERCIKAGTSEHGACSVCGAPWRRITEREPSQYEELGKHNGADFDRDDSQPQSLRGTSRGNQTRTASGTVPSLRPRVQQTTGWASSCEHDAPVVPCIVADPFMGSGTTALVARRLGRHAIGIELNAEYLAISATRLQQLSLLGGHA